MRSVSTRLNLAFPCLDVECIMTWKAFRETAGTSKACIAMAIRAAETCSPVVTSISSSLFFALGLIVSARARSSSVVSPMAERTTTTSFPDLYSSMQRFATLKMRSLPATELPPNFFTINIFPPAKSDSSAYIRQPIHCRSPPPSSR